MVHTEAPGGVAGAAALAGGAATEAPGAPTSPPFPEACGSPLGGGVREQPTARPDVTKRMTESEDRTSEERTRSIYRRSRSE